MAIQQNPSAGFSATGSTVDPAEVAKFSKLSDEWWDPIWKTYGTVDDVFYAAPLMASIKGFVWYSPSEFEENGWEVPTTIDELMTLSEQIAEDTGRQPLSYLLPLLLGSGAGAAGGAGGGWYSATSAVANLHCPSAPF